MDPKCLVNFWGYFENIILSKKIGNYFSASLGEKLPKLHNTIKARCHKQILALG